MTLENLTFVIQGPYKDGYTNELISSVIINYPKSPIIYSCYQSDKKNIDFSISDDIEFVFNLDPGHNSYLMHDKKTNAIVEHKQNVNRQIISTYAGLKKVKTDFCVKIRSDFTVKPSDLFRHLKDVSESEPTPITDKKIIVASFYSRNPYSILPLPLHPSDWFQIGLTSDLLKVWSVSHAKSSTELGCSDTNLPWFTKKYFPKLFTPEQYILVQFLKKINFSFESRSRIMNYQADVDEYFIKEVDMLMRQVFLFKNHVSLGFYPPSRIKICLYDRLSCYYEEEWKNLIVKMIPRILRPFKFFIQVLLDPSESKKMQKKNV